MLHIMKGLDMKAIGLLIICFSFMGTIWLATKVADYHLKKKDTEAPLALIYGGIFVSLWGALMITLIEML